MLRHSIWLLVLFLFFSCDRFNEGAVYAKLSQAEYARNASQPELLGYLSHNNPLVRARAVEVLGRIQDPARIIQVANRLTDNDEAVRRSAAFALGQFFDSRAEAYIREALQDEKISTIRTLLLDALGKSGSESSLLVLRDYIESSTEDYQNSAATSAGLLAYKRFPMHNLTPYLSALMKNSDNAEVAWHSAYALYQIGILRSFEDFQAALTHRDPLVRYYGLKGMRQMSALLTSEEIKEYAREPKVRELLRTYRSATFRKSLTDQLQDSTWYVRTAALELLGAMQEEVLQESMVKMLDDPSLTVQLTAIRELGAPNLRNWYTRRETRRLYREAEDWRIKGEALAVLSTIQATEALRSVEEDLMNKPWPQNYYAIKALKAIESDAFADDPVRRNSRAPNQTTVDKATLLLVTLAEADNQAQQTLALEALVERRKPPETEYFVKKLEKADMAQTTILAGYFAQLGSTSEPAIDPLISAYQRLTPPRDLEALEPIIAALDSIGSRKALPFLEKELASPYPSLREAARRALQSITGNADVRMPPVRQLQEARWDFPPVGADSLYQLKFFTTRGDFVMDLYPGKAPVNVANIVSLVRKNFYNGIYFHRIVPGFVAQFGDPRGDGWGGPGYSVPCEYNDIPYERGTVGMAHAGKDTGGSQLFITHTPQPHLTGKHTVIGKVISGMKIVDRLMVFDQILGTELNVTAANPVATR